MLKSVSRLLLLLFLAGGLMSVALASTPRQLQPLDRIVAIVNSDVITQSQLDQAVKILQLQLQQAQQPIPSEQAVTKQALDHLIDIKLQLQVAKAHNIKVKDSSVTQTIQNIAQQNGLTTDQLFQKVAAQGMTEKQYRQEIHDEMVISQLQQQAVANNINITDQEIKDMMGTLGPHPMVFATTSPNTEYHVENILVSLPANANASQQAQAQQQAQQLVTQLRHGGNFDQIVNSQFAAQQAAGQVDLGWRRLGDLPDIFTPYVQNMQIGDIAGPIQAPNGFHIIKLVAMRGGSNSTQHLTEQTQVRHILIKINGLVSAAQANARLEKIRNQILQGADFGQMAELNSQDSASATQGGSIGWISTGMVDPQFEKIMDGLQPGQISEPFGNDYAWQIIQVLGRRQINDSKQFADIQVRQAIFKRKFSEALDDWLQQLRSTAYIKVMTNE